MSIANRALLVNLSISLPGNSRKDKKLTGEVLAERNMGNSAGKWLKQIYPDEALEPLMKLQGAARVYSYSKTLPWKDEGWRILPTTITFEYMKGIREFRAQFEQSTRDFIRRYDEWIQWGQNNHNGNFNPADYPGAHVIQQKFGFRIQTQPIPSSGHFLFEAADEELKQAQSELDDRVNDAVKEAQKDLFRRLQEPIAHMAEKLKVEGATFHGSLVGNIQKIVDIIPALNITGDKEIERFRIEIEKTLAKESPDILRTNKLHRADIAKQAQEMAEKLAGYL
jgi:hypothetical protein